MCISLADQNSVPLLQGELFFLVQPMDFSALAMLKDVTCTLNSSNRKSTISSWYGLGFSSNCLQRASNIGGAMVQGRPTLFGGALVEPKSRIFDLIRWILGGLQPATLAISLALNKVLLAIISLISTCCDSARCGAIPMRRLPCRKAASSKGQVPARNWAATSSLLLDWRHCTDRDLAFWHKSVSISVVKDTAGEYLKKRGFPEK